LFSHCNDVCRTSLMRLLVFCTPGSNSIAQMSAPVVYLSVVTHVGDEGLQDSDGRRRRLKEMYDVWVKKNG
jgi:hypothetical protein